jgi:hypothetical protein
LLFLFLPLTYLKGSNGPATQRPVSNRCGIFASGMRAVGQFSAGVFLLSALGCGGAAVASSSSTDFKQEGGVLAEVGSVAEASDLADAGGGLLDAANAVETSESTDASNIPTSSCEGSANALAALVRPAGTASELVVRLDYLSRRILAWHYFSDASSAPVAEDVARRVAVRDTGYGDAMGTWDKLLSGSDPSDEFVFFQAPLDFGGVAAVSKRSGLSVFGGSIVWSGKGDITYPKTWSSPEELGSDCSSSGASVSARGFNLVEDPALALDPTQVASALEVLGTTAISLAFSKSGQSTLDAMVLLYPRSVGELNPKTAEWIVILNTVHGAT